MGMSISGSGEEHHQLLFLTIDKAIPHRYCCGEREMGLTSPIGRSLQWYTAPAGRGQAGADPDWVTSNAELT